MKRKIALLLVIALILSFIPVIVANAAETTVVYQKISTMDELTTGQYILVDNTGYALKTYSTTGWILTGKPTVSGNEITAANADGYIWDLTVTGTSVTLKDSAGKFVKPKSGNNNGIQNGTYNWAVSCTSGAFQFKGTGSDTTTLARNGTSGYRAYKNKTVTDNPNGYPSKFTLYKQVTITTEDPTQTETTTPPTTEPPVPTYNGTFYKLTAENQLTTGKYVAIVSGYAATYYDSSTKWVLAEALTVTGDSITNPAEAMVWDITVTDGTVTLTDSNGASIKPNSTADSSIASGTHNWTVAYKDGTFQFNGSGDYSAFTLAANSGSSYKLRAYKSSTVSGNPNGYPSYFTLYRLVENGTELPTVPPTTEPATPPATEPTEPATTEPATEAPTQGSGDIVYVYGDAGKYTDVIINWGTRDEVATQLSPNAIAFYNANNTSYGILSALNGSSTVSGVPSSPLYLELQELMVNNHDMITTYDETCDLYQFTDAQKSGAIGMTCFYSGETIGPEWDSGSTWNREHCWPVSLSGSESKTNGNADIMTLRPTVSGYNSSRGSKGYGQVTDTTYFNPNHYTTEYDLRGDVARIVLYSYVRWSYTSLFGASGVIESKDVLLNWIEIDPVDTWELGRNDSVESITGTRNVFVDYPELAFVLFGETVPASMQTPSGNAGSQTPTDPTEPSTPATQPTEPVAGGDYQKITSMDQLTTGKYVLVVAGTSKGDVAMGTLDSTWVTSGLPTITGDTITKENAEGYILTLTVTNGTVTIKDANGKFISSSNSDNKMAEGETSWRVDFADGTFRFVHTGGADERYLSLNRSSDSGFRPYKSVTATANSGGYPSYFTLYKLTEGTSEDNIIVGASYNVHLIEPWALRVNVQFAKNTQDNMIPVSNFTDYGAYAIISSKFSGTTAEELMDDPDAVKYTKADGNITVKDAATLTFDFYDGLYSYNLGESVYWVAYFETADGTYYTSVQIKSLTDVADSLLGEDGVSESEKAVLNSMKEMKDSVIALRGENADLGNTYAPGVANTNGLGDRNTGYAFGAAHRIKLIEPWGVRVRVLMRDKTAAMGVYADYEGADDYGLIFFHDKTGKYNGTMTAAQMSAETEAKVYSKGNGNAVINANGVTAVYDQEIYTYDLDTNLYCLPYIVIEGEYYYPSETMCWNLLDEMVEFSENEDLDPKETAVFDAILKMYDNVQNHMN